MVEPPNSGNTNNVNAVNSNGNVNNPNTNNTTPGVRPLDSVSLITFKDVIIIYIDMI